METPRTVTLPSPGQSLEPTGRELRVGDLLEDTWRVSKKLGEGGMGTVVLAHDLKLKRDVAVKLLARALCSDPGAVARFEREAALTAQLEHPNIVPVYAVGRFFERPFIVMKPLEGEPLSDRLKARDKIWSWAEVRPLLVQLCAGLGFLHARALVHRDMKPSNIFLSPDGHLTLLDFGVIKDVSSDITRTGQLLGTLRFMAPEQVSTPDDVDARADIYAVGVILYRLLAGKTPFEGDDLTVVQRKLSLEPPSPTVWNPKLPAAVAAVLQRAVARDPARRLQSIDELLPALDAAFAEDPRSSGRRRGALIALAVAVTALLGGGAVLLSQGAPPVAEPPIAPAPVPAPVPPVVVAPLPAPAPAEVAPPVRVAVEPPAPRPIRRAHPAAHPVAAPLEVPVKLSVVSRVDGRSSYAELFIDGKSHGETPTQVDLLPGPHLVRLKREGFANHEQRVVVEAGRAQRLVVDLTP